MGPLASDILTLVRTRTAQTNPQILRTLSARYDISRHTIKTILCNLTKRGYLRRVVRGRYEVAR